MLFNRYLRDRLGESMTMKQLEQRVTALERQVAELRREFIPLRPLNKVEETFGMFGDDPDFDEIVRFGREYRYRQNRTPW